jgi:arylformamidase
MKIHDISVPISPDMPVYQGDPAVQVTPVSRTAQGAGSNCSMLCFGTHTGTHVDPPFHFVESGIKVDELPLSTLVGDCLVYCVEEGPVILRQQLESRPIPEGTERILFKTGNSALWQQKEFQTHFTYLSPEAAELLVDRGIKLIGIDYLSIDQFKSPGHATHHRLLGAGVIVLEGLDLSQVEEGTYTLICLPLKIQDGDGGPARAILIER